MSKECECGCGAPVAEGKRFVKGHHFRKQNKPEGQTFPPEYDTSKAQVGEALKLAEKEPRQHDPEIDERFVVTRTDDTPKKRLFNPMNIDPENLPKDSEGKPVAMSWQDDEHIPVLEGMGYHMAKPGDVKNWKGTTKDGAVQFGSLKLMLTTRENQDRVTGAGQELAEQKARSMGFLPKDEEAAMRAKFGGRDREDSGVVSQAEGQKMRSGVLSTSMVDMAKELEDPGG